MKNIYGFEKTTSQKVITVIEIIVITLLSLLIIAILAFNFLFKKDGVAPNLFGYNIYLSRASTMGENIPNNSAVFAKQDVENLKPGNVVLVNIQIEQDTYTTILRIMDMKEQDGTTYYLLKGDASPDTETFLVPESAIVAQALKVSEAFGKFLVFSTSQIGILLVIIIPCVIIILVQIFRIIRVNRLEEDEEFDNIDFDEDEEVVFSTRRAGIGIEEEAEEEPPVRKMYVNDSGKADFRKEPPPTANIRDFDRSVKDNYNPIKTIPSTPSRSTIAKKNSIAANFSQKPVTAKKPEISAELFEKPKPVAERRYDSDYTSIYERPVQRKPQQEIPLAPPVVENPVAITIPTEAVKPKETIAPPPKRNSNKTVEELMRVIDNAQAGKPPRA